MRTFDYSFLERGMLPAGLVTLSAPSVNYANAKMSVKTVLRRFLKN